MRSIQPLFTLVFSIYAFAVYGPAFALTPEEAASRLFGAETVDRAWFAGQGLASAVPPVIEDVQEELGPLTSVEPCTEQCLAIFKKGELTFNITVDSEGLITGILIDPPIIYATSLAEAIDTLTSLMGNVSVFVTRNGDTLVDERSTEPMAVGSAFKLAVLKALNNLIGAGKLEWNQVFQIKDEWRSLPSGQLQEWPRGAPLTLHTLASLMISVSDNTATDALIDIATRNSVEMVSPRNRPFLTTREFFHLKHVDRDDLRNSYVEGSFDERMAILRSFEDQELPRISQLNTDAMLSAEWLFTTSELCELMDDVRDLDVLKINPGVARASDWKSISYKGGSSFGAVNLTTGVTAEDGTIFCVSATWNDDQALDEETFFVLYGSILHQLRTH
jgi:Beta-lactamase enzyme family